MDRCPLDGKPCSNCKSYHIVNLEKDKVQDVDICLECLSNLKNSDLKIENNNVDCCDFCGMTIEELLKYSKMGCSKCYNKYEKPLVFSLEKLQKLPKKDKKELRHVGKAPYLWKMQQAENTDPIKFLLELKQKLVIFIKYEKYEKASDIRNKIKAFEHFIKKVDEFKEDLEQCELIKKQIAEFIYLFRESELEEN